MRHRLSDLALATLNQNAQSLSPERRGGVILGGTTSQSPPPRGNHQQYDINVQSILEEIPSIVYVSPDELENNSLIDDFKMHQLSLRGGRIQFALDQPLDLNQFKTGSQRTLVAGASSSVHSNNLNGNQGLVSGLSSHFGNRGPTTIGGTNHTIPLKKQTIQQNLSAYKNKDTLHANQSPLQPSSQNLMPQRTYQNVEIHKPQFRSGSIGDGTSIFQHQNDVKAESIAQKIQPNARIDFMTGRKRNQSIHSVGGMNIEFNQQQAFAPQASTSGQQRLDHLKNLQNQSVSKRRLSQGATIDPQVRLPQLNGENGLSTNSFYNNSTIVQNKIASRNHPSHKYSHSQNPKYENSQATIRNENFHVNNKSSISSFIGPRSRADVVLSGSQLYQGPTNRDGFGPDSSSSVYQLYQNRIRPGAEAIFQNDMVHIGGGAGGAGFLHQFDSRHQKHFSSEDAHSETSIPRWHYVGGPGSTSSYLTPPGPGSVGRGIRMPAPQALQNALHSGAFSVRPSNAGPQSDNGKISINGDISGGVASLSGPQADPYNNQNSRSGENTTSGGDGGVQQKNSSLSQHSKGSSYVPISRKANSQVSVTGQEAGRTNSDDNYTASLHGSLQSSERPDKVKTQAAAIHQAAQLRRPPPPGLRYQVQEMVQLTGTSEDLCINIETMSDRSQKLNKFRELPYQVQVQQPTIFSNQQRLQIQQAVAAGLPPPNASVLTSFIDTRDLNYGSQGSQQSRHSSSGGQTGFYDQQPYSSSSLPEESEESKSLSKSSLPDRDRDQIANVGVGAMQPHAPQHTVKQVQFNIEDPQTNLLRIQQQNIEEEKKANSILKKMAKTLKKIPKLRIVLAPPRPPPSGNY